jgi:NADH dehydrogenase FAD-containing subunit
MLQRAKSALLFTRLVIYAFKLAFVHLRRAASAKLASLTARGDPATPRTRNIVIVGANYAGYHAARLISTGLPRGSPFRVVVVEPNDHFNFTWVLPRFCVVQDHEHKAFIPYVGYLSAAPAGAVRWVRDRVAAVGRTSVRLRDSGEEVPYEFLVVATGSEVAEGLPSRVGAETKAEGVELLRAVQRRIKAARKVVVAGGGAAGVELATDAKSAYPDKPVVLVHSRKEVMNRFGPGLHKAALEGLERLGVEVILEEKVASHNDDEGFVTLSSGRKVDCDCYVC